VKLRLRVGDTEQIVEFDRTGADCRLRFAAESGPVELNGTVLALGDGGYLVLSGGHAYEARIDPGNGMLRVHLRGETIAVGVEDPRRFVRGRRNVGLAGTCVIRAQMPGKVVRVLAGPGQVVEPSQGLLVLEAMKMQNEIKAPAAGRVVSVAVKQGDTVTAGQELATIE
jgi:acetyl/propionyl-CoA carboxylase alpha subunit